MEVDVDQQLRFPEAICISTQRQDIVIYSLKLRKVILIKLTCPAEENIEESHSEKKSCCESLLKDCINAGKFTSLQQKLVQGSMQLAHSDHVCQN